MNYERGLKRMQPLLPEAVQEEFGELAKKLRAILSDQRLYGSAPSTDEAKYRIVARLIQIARRSGMSFVDLCT